MKTNSDIKTLGQSIGADRLAEDLINPKKGFKFFIVNQFQDQMMNTVDSDQVQINTATSEVASLAKNLEDIYLDPTALNIDDDHEDYNYEDEDFTWYDQHLLHALFHAQITTMRDDTYFVLVNCERKTIKKGEQVYYCYGKRSNAFLLLNYGFCIPDNKYDSHIFKVKLNVNIAEDISNDQQINQNNISFNYKKKININDYSELVPHPDNETDVLCSEEIRLKFDQINSVLLGYLRTIFRTYYQHKQISEIQEPKEIDYEIFIFKKYLGLMEFLKYFKEKKSTLEQDLELLNNPDISYYNKL